MPIALKSKLDWAPIRQEFETTLISARALAEKNGITPAAITYQVKHKGWKRNAPEFAEHGNRLPATSIKLSPNGTQLTEVPIADDIEALAKLRDRIIGQHKVDVSRDMAYLNALEKDILEKKSAPLQKLNSLALVVKIRSQLIELERQAHSIVANGSDRPPVAVQVNVNVSPQDAYRQLIEGK